MGIMLTITIAKYLPFSFCSACKYKRSHVNFQNILVSVSSKWVSNYISSWPNGKKKGIFGGDMGEMQYDITHKSTWFLAET